MRRPASSNPYGAFMIFQKSKDSLSIKLRKQREIALFPTCKAFRGANPHRPISGNQKEVDRTRSEMFISYWLSVVGPHSINAHQAKVGAQPELPFGRPSNGFDEALGKAGPD